MLVENLNDNPNNMLATGCNANQPANERLIILQVVRWGKVYTCGAHYQNGKWYGHETGMEINIEGAQAAIWTESLVIEAGWN